MTVLSICNRTTHCVTHSLHGVPRAIQMVAFQYQRLKNTALLTHTLNQRRNTGASVFTVNAWSIKVLTIDIPPH